jgi:hypothetical protein
MADIGAKKQSALTAEEFRRLFHYEPETGVFTRLYSSQGCIAGAPVGSFDKRGYLRIGLHGFTYSAHRLAWLYVHGVWPSKYIDHINGDKGDNRITNLRDASPTVNSRNRRVADHMGTSKDERTNKWRSSIKVNGKRKHLGMFDDQRAAHEAYVAAKRELHEGCTL